MSWYVPDPSDNHRQAQRVTQAGSVTLPSRRQDGGHSRYDEIARPFFVNEIDDWQWHGRGLS
jgi:hypothetical protein